MAQPTAYDRLINFLTYALAHTAAPYNASDHDAEFDAIEQTLDELLANIALIQRDDGLLKNASVHPDSLSPATLILIEAMTSAEGLSALVRGSWVTATAYTKGQLVQSSTTSYICAVAHTSGVFATDYTAGKWIVLGSSAANAASGISFTPAGDIAATNVQTAIQELDTEKAAKNGSASNLFSVSDATDDEHAVTMGQIQKGSLISAAGGGTADAMTATIVSGLIALVDGMLVIIEAPGTNTLTNPTFNLTLGSTATGAKTIVKAGSVALAAGDIASNKLLLCYDSSLGKWVLLNPQAYLPLGGGTMTGGLVMSGAIITPSQTKGILGTNTNNYADAGSVGEYLSASVTSASAVSLVTTVSKNVTSIALTAGDWWVGGAVAFTYGATTSITHIQGSASQASNTLDADIKFSMPMAAFVPGANSPMAQSVPVTRVILAAPATIYLVAYGTFTVSTLSAFGHIFARRAR